MRKVVAALLSLPVLLLAASCSSRGGDGMTFRDVTVVDDFPEVVKLYAGSAEIVNLDVPGIMDIISRDSILIAVSTRESPIVSLFDYSSFEPRGGFLRHGNGPKELLPFYFPSRYRTRFYVSSGSLYAEIANADKNILRWNVSAAYSEGAELVESLPAMFAPKSLFKWQLNDSTVLGRRLENSSTQLVREVYVSGEARTPAFLEELDEARINTPNDGFMINLLSTLVAYNPERDIVAESAMSLNVINIYSLHSGFHKSLQMGRTRPSIAREEKKTKEEEYFMPQYIWYSAAYDDFFGILYGQGREREILLFSWDGKPLRKYVLDETVSAFDINGDTLLTLCAETETIRKYELQ